MTDLQKRQSELEFELTEATKKECTSRLEVEKLENELGVKKDEMLEATTKLEQAEREANQAQVQISEIKKDFDIKGLILKQFKTLAKTLI